MNKTILIICALFLFFGVNAQKINGNWKYLSSEFQRLSGEERGTPNINNVIWRDIAQKHITLKFRKGKVLGFIVDSTPKEVEYLLMENNTVLRIVFIDNRDDNKISFIDYKIKFIDDNKIVLTNQSDFFLQKFTFAIK